VLQAGVLALGDGGGVEAVVEDVGDVGQGGQGQAGALEDEVVLDAGLDVPAVVLVVVVGGVDVGRDDRRVGAEQPGVVERELGVDLAGVQVVALGEDVGEVAGLEDERAEVPLDAEVGADLLEAGDRVGRVDVDERADERVGELAECRTRGGRRTGGWASGGASPRLAAGRRGRRCRSRSGSSGRS
jgi:hypothetical protein